MVYEPREDSDLLVRVVRERASGSCLDMGCGSGIQAVAACDVCTSVLAVDIDPDAVAATFAQRIPAVQSDLFANVKGMFDTIICNTPYLPLDPAAPDIALDGGRRGFEWTLRFLDEARSHLTRHGRILFLISSLTNPAVIESWLLEQAFTWEVVARERVFFEELLVYEARFALPDRPDAVFVARGKRSRVYRDGGFAVKVAEPRRIAQEAFMLQKVNAIGIGPKYISHEKTLLVMEYLDGPRLKEFLLQASRKAGATVLRNVMDQLHALDRASIEKKEMRNPYKHIIISQGQPVLIDWERARVAEKTHNVSAFREHLKFLSKDEALQWIADRDL